MSATPTDSPDALTGIIDVSRETIDRLTRYVELLRAWQTRENLVAPATLPTLWRRHIADSAQLAPMLGGSRLIIDLGSGGGFPGLVLAIVTGVEAHLVESNTRKGAFLRTVIRETDAPATVHTGRIEDVIHSLDETPDIVTARALAPLDALLRLAAPLLTEGSRGLFHKGRGYADEVDEARWHWHFDLVIHPSRVDSHGVILDVTRPIEKTETR
jgi:16S rRNA (guanine527-N7)-methyltransferase